MFQRAFEVKLFGNWEVKESRKWRKHCVYALKVLMVGSEAIMCLVVIAWEETMRLQEINQTFLPFLFLYTNSFSPIPLFFL